MFTDVVLWIMFPTVKQISKQKLEFALKCWIFSFHFSSGPVNGSVAVNCPIIGEFLRFLSKSQSLIEWPRLALDSWKIC